MLLLLTTSGTNSFSSLLTKKFILIALRYVHRIYIWPFTNDVTLPGVEGWKFLWHFVTKWGG